MDVSIVMMKEQMPLCVFTHPELQEYSGHGKFGGAKSCPPAIPMAAEMLYCSLSLPLSRLHLVCAFVTLGDMQIE